MSYLLVCLFEVLASAQATAPEPEKKPVAKWFEKMSIRGYVQLRYNLLLHQEGEGDWYVPGDRSVREGAGLFLRRGRLILSGDTSERIFLYLQTELNALPADGDFSLQLRDLYADIDIDKRESLRLRVGQSKIPYGFSNLQSSQNRLALERPDPISSAAEGERDIGMFLYWAPPKVRAYFKSLVKDGLKGSGDYGVVGLGIYNGQGLNRLDLNPTPHIIARVSYPLQISDHLAVEPGLQGYRGLFVPEVGPLPSGVSEIEPSVPEQGVLDERVAASLVIYPKPVGIETEWNIGRGPTLDGAEIESMPLWGGYVQGSVRIPVDNTVLFPFTRWQTYEGGRKFATNAPHVRIDEWDFGTEWSPLSDLELTAVYTYTPHRTTSNAVPYSELSQGSRVGMQLQWSY